MKKAFLLQGFLSLAVLIEYAEGQVGVNCANKRPATLPAGATYISNPNCPNGDSYNTPTPTPQHCHCWSHCGYICEPRAAPAPAPVTTPRAPAAPAPVTNTCTNRPATLPAGATYIRNPNCPNGDTYNTPTPTPQHCHCWSHCGYICEPRAAPAPAPVPTTTRRAPAPTPNACAGVKPSSIPAGSKWVADPNCKNGNVYDTPGANGQPGFHCHCWGHCGYICDPKANPAPGPTTRAPTTTTKAASPCPFGGVWVPPNDTSLRCICQSYNKEPYYKCTPNNSSTTTTSTVSPAPSNTTESSVSPSTGSSSVASSASTAGSSVAASASTTGSSVASSASTAGSSASTESTTAGSSASTEASTSSTSATT